MDTGTGFAVILDIDGTLIEAYEQLFKDCCRTAQKLGLRAPSRQEFLAVLPLPWAQLLNTLWPDISVEAFNEQFKEQPAKAVPGARRVILGLKKKGYFLAIISNREWGSLCVRMDQVKMSLDIFDYVQAVGDFEFAKPDPRVFNRALTVASKKGIPRSRVVYVGDTLLDYEAAKGAGIMFVAVLTGGTTREQFMAAGLDEAFILNSVKDLPDFLAEKK